MNHRNFSQTTLAAAITDTTGTAITVTSGATFPAAPFIISIDTEAMLVTVVAGTTWTVTRGYEGSTAATHSNGAIIYHDISAAEADSIAAKKTDNVSETDKVLGRSSAGAGVIEEIACTPFARTILDDANASAQLATLGLTATAAELNVLHGSSLTAITVAGAELINDIDAAAQRATLGAMSNADATVTYAKMQHVSATNKILGRATAGAGDVEEIACSAPGRNLISQPNNWYMLQALGINATTAELNFVAGVTSAIQTQLNTKAPLASPTLTGVPAAPTAAVDTDTTQLATTAMVVAQAASATPLIDAATAVVGTSKRFARADHVHPTDTGRAAATHTHVKANITDLPTISAAGAELINDANAAAQLATLGTAAYSEGTWTPILNGFTIVGSAPAVSGTWKRIGNLVFITCTINAGSGGNTSVACINTNSSITGIPVNQAETAACIVTDSATENLGIGAMGSNTIYPPTLSAKTVPVYIFVTYNA